MVPVTHPTANMRLNGTTRPTSAVVASGTRSQRRGECHGRRYAIRLVPVAMRYTASTMIAPNVAISQPAGSPGP